MRCGVTHSFLCIGAAVAAPIGEPDTLLNINEAWFRELKLGWQREMMGLVTIIVVLQLPWIMLSSWPPSSFMNLFILNLNIFFLK